LTLTIGRIGTALLIIKRCDGERLRFTIIVKRSLSPSHHITRRRTQASKASVSPPLHPLAQSFSRGDSLPPLPCGTFKISFIFGIGGFLVLALSEVRRWELDLDFDID